VAIKRESAVSVEKSLLNRVARPTILNLNIRMVFARMLEHLVRKGTRMKLLYIVNTRIFFMIMLKGLSAYCHVSQYAPKTDLLCALWFQTEA
jgi:hypothetical protein